MAGHPKPKVEVEEAEGVRLLHLREPHLGWDANAPLLKETLLEAVGPARAIALDMSQVSYLASPTIGTILSFNRDVTQDGRRLVLYGMQPYVRGTFTALRLDDVIEICRTRREALDRLKAVDVASPR